MSHISPKPDQQTIAETATLANLTSLSASGTGEFLRKIGTTSFENATPGDADTGITQLTGDVTAGPGFGSQVTTLATVNSNVGSFASATQVGTFTVNAKGLVTAAGNTAIAIPSTQVTDFTEAAQDAVGAMVDTTLVYVDATPLLTRAALTGDITAPQASNVTTLATVNGNVGTFGSATQAGVFTVNAKGLITAASNTTVTPNFANVLGGTAGSVIFSNGTNLAQDNSNFFWDDTNNRLGIGTASPAGGLDVRRAIGTFATVGAPSVRIGINNTTPSIILDTNTSIYSLDYLEGTGIRWVYNGSTVPMVLSSTGLLTLTTTSSVDTSKGISVSHAGGIIGTGYAGYFSKTGASTTNVGLYATATGATNNYAAIFEAGKVGIGTTAPSTLLHVGLAGTTLGTLGLAGNTSGLVTIQPAAAAGTWTMTLPTTGGTTGYALTTNGSGTTTWSADIVGNAGTVTFVDAGSDTTTFVALGTSATGNLSPATDSALTYNASTNVLTSGAYIGASIGSSTNPANTPIYFTGTTTTVGTLQVDSVSASAEPQYRLNRTNASSYTLTTNDRVGALFWNTMSAIYGIATADVTGGFSTVDIAFRSTNAAGVAAERMRITAEGLVGIGTTAIPLAQLFVVSAAAANVGFIVKGATSQSGNLTQWQNSSASVLARVASDGAFTSEATTASSSITTGAIISKGGLGVATNIYLGGDIRATTAGANMYLGNINTGKAIYFSQTATDARIESDGYTIDIRGRDSGQAVNIFTGSGTTPAVAVSNAYTLRYGQINASAGAWTIQGIQSRTSQNGSRTYTDTTSSGTVAFTCLNSIGGSTIAASSVTTYTDTATLYLEGSPAAGSNVTMTNRWGLYSDASIYTGTSLKVAGTTASTSTTTGSGIFGGGIGVAGAGYFGGVVSAATTIELGAATDTTLSRVSAGVVAIEGVNILTVAGGTLTGSLTLGENTSIALDPAGSADGKYSGITMTAVAGYAQTYGDLVYLSSVDSRWELADADAATTADRMLAMVVVAGGSDGAACTLLLQGNIRADAKFPALTIGSAVYVGETAGAIQVAIPTGADNIIKRVGFALTADEIYFNPSNDSQVTVA